MGEKPYLIDPSTCRNISKGCRNSGHLDEFKRNNKSLVWNTFTKY